jgi:hypothetical protein
MRRDDISVNITRSVYLGEMDAEFGCLGLDIHRSAVARARTSAGCLELVEILLNRGGLPRCFTILWLASIE